MNQYRWRRGAPIGMRLVKDFGPASAVRAAPKVADVMTRSNLASKRLFIA